MKIRSFLPAAFALAAPLCAQAVFMNADKPDAKVCPRIEDNAAQLSRGGIAAGNTTAGQLGAQATGTRFYQEGEAFFPKGERKSVATFAALPQSGPSIPVSSLKGKVVLVGLWSTSCQPSASMLMELADLYPKREKFGFEILAVNFDRDRWTKILPFMKNKQNAEFFKGLPIYTAGLGKEGANLFMDEIYSVPLLAVIDREGNLASLTLGYTPNYVAQALSRVLREGAPPKPAAAPAAPKPAN
jgi:thiol-disulfide isomerase/thioredoxin